MLLPYIWEYRWRVIISFVLLVAAKVANVGVPIALKEIVDSFEEGKAVYLLPAIPLIIYAALRLSATLFQEFRDLVFVHVSQRALRRVSLTVFEYLHSLSLRFHLGRQTGGVARDIERGTTGIYNMLYNMLFSILPVIVEFVLVATVLFAKFDWRFAAITFFSVGIYMWFTFKITEWRLDIRRKMNELDSLSNTIAVDSLINYETVKYFNNERYEAKRFEDKLKEYEIAAVKNERSLAYLYMGQSFIIAGALAVLMFLAADGVIRKTLTLGDLVLINGLLIQLYIPLDSLGAVYREMKQGMVDMQRMFNILSENLDVQDRPDARVLEPGSVAVRFESVDFHYQPDRQILHKVEFEVPAGTRTAIVGHSGSGKSTLARLLYRLYDVTDGRITVNGNDIRGITQLSLRSAIAIVPQDTVLFNESILYNIRYGRPEASDEEVFEAARAAHIHDFIRSLPEGYETNVGERGLKLSGGEKQRVAIARALLKRPRIMIFDEATSALDSKSERAIQEALDEVAHGHTTLAIAHRLSTIAGYDQIIVMDAGRIAERGTHSELLARGAAYAQMWALQQVEASEPST